MVLLASNLVITLLLRLASLAITFVLDNLILDPILSALIGTTRFYKLRGYFYDFVLGQEFKEI